MTSAVVVRGVMLMSRDELERVHAGSRFNAMR
jgi:hypothetical protein